MAYSKTAWENNITPISAANLNNLENGVEDVDERLSDVENSVSALENNIGDLTDLETSDTSSIVNSINEVKRENNINSSYAAASYAGSAISGSDSSFSGFDTFRSNGNLTPTSSGITIGADINYILVSGAMILQNGSSSYNLAYSGITKNGNTIEILFTELRNSNGAQGFISLPVTIIPVEEGDVIAIYSNGATTTNIRRAYLNVKAIG